MRRILAYNGEIPFTADILNTNRNLLKAMGLLAQDVLGSATSVSGLACSPTTPGSLAVSIAAGRVYSMQTVDSSAYSDIGTDTDQVIKQGILAAAITLNCPAPVTTGQSINYLIEAQYQDSDTGSAVLPYYNLANPLSPLSGPGGLGTPQNTLRDGIISLIAKAGFAATSGTQVTPPPDAGYIGLWVVTVAFGATAVVSGNIAQSAGAPFLSTSLSSGLLTQAAADARYLAIYLRTSAEITAGVTPVNLQFPPGTVDRYGTNAIPGTTDMSVAVQAAVSGGGGQVYFGNLTYLFGGVNVAQSVVIQGQGPTTVLKCPTHTITGAPYSTNLFTDTAANAAIAFKNLTLDGGCTQTGNQANAWEVSMVKLTQTKRVLFENVSLTGYAASSGNVNFAIPTQFFQAITIQFAQQVDFVGFLSFENYYPQVQMYFAPGSDAKINLSRCSLINSAGGTAFQTFVDISGGHTTISDMYCLNCRSDSIVNIQVPQSLRVHKSRFINEVGAAGQVIAINVGQDLFPYNNNVVIEGNYFFGVSEAIAICQGANQVIRDNVIVHCSVYGIECVSGLTSTQLTQYTACLPAYASGAFPASALPTTSLTIEGNTIVGVVASGTNAAITVRSISGGTQFWFQYVNVNDNVLQTDTSFVHNIAIHFADCNNINIERNFLGYGASGISCDQTAANVNIIENTFTAVPSTSQDDIIFSAAIPANVTVRANNFTTYPLKAFYNVNFFNGGSGGVNGALIQDNIGMKQSFPVFSNSVTDYVIRNTKQKRFTATPAAGSWGVGDVAYSIPATGVPQEWDCTASGAFRAISGVTLSYVSGNFFATQTAGSTLIPGDKVSIVKGLDGTNPLVACVLQVVGATVQLDAVFGSTQTSQATTIVNPTFHASANFA